MDMPDTSQKDIKTTGRKPKDRSSFINAAGPRFPLPGQRILRTMIAVWICMGIYYIRGRSGLTFMAVIAAIQCIQPYTKNMRQAGWGRVIGTLLGALWGALMLYLEYLAVGTGQMAEALRLFLAGALSGAVIYGTVLLGVQERAYFATVVFLGIVMNHATDADPSIYIINRFLDTMIGVGIGTMVNSLHFPRGRHTELLFLAGIGQVAPGEEHTLSPYTKVELNRLIDDGARFTVLTRQSPATIREVTEGINLTYPVIAVDGAVIYDMQKRHYLYAEGIDEDLAARINAVLKEKNAQHFIITLEDDLMTIYYHEMQEGTMKHRYLAKRRSLYRNYVHTEREICQDVLYFVAMGIDTEIVALSDYILSQPWADQCRIVFDNYDCEDDELIMRIYSAQATRKRMIKRLQKELGTEKTIKFGSSEEGVDEALPYYGDRMVKELKRRFEPIDIRGWKNIVKWS